MQRKILNLQEYSICWNENSKLLFIWQTCVKIAKVLLYLRSPNGYLDNYLWLWVPTKITWFMTSGSCVWFFLFLFQMGNSTWWPFVYVFFFSSEFLFEFMGFVKMISSLTLGPKWDHELTYEITFASDSYDWTIILVRMGTL